MSSRTVTALLDAPKEQVFDYLSQIDNLPKWASEFARELRYEHGKAKVVNGLGEFYVSIDADRDTGVIDMYVGPTESELALFPTRVVALPAGGSCLAAVCPLAQPCSRVTEAVTDTATIKLHEWGPQAFRTPDFERLFRALNQIGFLISVEEQFVVRVAQSACMVRT